MSRPGDQKAVTVDANWAYCGFRAIALENRHLRAIVLPELGAKVWSLIDKATDREVLWHNPRLLPRPAPYGASYDDWFCGGWDELFPNDAPTSVAGDAYPDHGELWSMPFDWSIEQERGWVRLRMRRAGVVTNTTIEKSITLYADEPQLRMHHRISNHGPQALDFLWKLHPALRITPGARIDLPAANVLVDAGFRDRLGCERFAWPFAQRGDGDLVDVRVVPPPEAASCDFYYATDLAQGWCALTDPAARAGFGLAFDPAIFSSVWVFGAYGGWRGLYTTILEPCTGYPYRLEEAIAQGTASRLAAGATLESELLAVVYRGVSAVSAISRAGEVT